MASGSPFSTQSWPSARLSAKNPWGLWPLVWPRMWVWVCFWKIPWVAFNLPLEDRPRAYRVFHDTGHPQILAECQALYKHELDTRKFSKCMILYRAWNIAKIFGVQCCETPCIRTELTLVSIPSILCWFPPKTEESPFCITYMSPETAAHRYWRSEPQLLLYLTNESSLWTRWH